MAHSIEVGYEAFGWALRSVGSLDVFDLTWIAGGTAVFPGPLDVSQGIALVGTGVESVRRHPVGIEVMRVLVTRTPVFLGEGNAFGEVSGAGVGVVLHIWQSELVRGDVPQVGWVALLGRCGRPFGGWRDWAVDYLGELF